MKKLSKIGLILLLSYLSVNTLTDEDFVNLKKYFSSKSKNIFSKIKEKIFEIESLVSDDEVLKNEENSNLLILEKLKNINDEIKKIKSQEIVSLIEKSENNKR
ncbi:hypothetical protein IKD48_00995 [bacterium]|nr:hypothetical protein [bacterium]MBR2652254.1 hypothetical protein [bacterium]